MELVKHVITDGIGNRSLMVMLLREGAGNWFYKPRFNHVLNLFFRIGIRLTLIALLPFLKGMQRPASRAGCTYLCGLVKNIFKCFDDFLHICFRSSCIVPSPSWIENKQQKWNDHVGYPWYLLLVKPVGLAWARIPYILVMFPPEKMV